MEGGAIPARRTSFIGRASELESLQALLPDARLISLTGAGGSGKTSLACELARRSVSSFDISLVIDLSAVVSADAVVPAIAAVLRVEHDRSAIVAWCRANRALLVLDDCEDLLEPVAEVIDAILDGAPDVRVVVTSRDPIGIRGEVVWAVPPLGVPEADANIEAIEATESGRLFLERARAIERSFTAGPEDAEAITTICRELEGLPLAIELAAARVSMMTPTEIAVRLDDRFRLLRATKRATDRRHATLEATVEWSYDLLTPPERVLLARLSIFSGGVSLDAIEAVCGAEPLQREQIMDALDGLVRRSLADVERTSAGARAQLGPTARAFARERLAASEEQESLRARHLAWLEPSLERLRADGDNDVELAELHGALGWALAAGDAATAARVASVLAPVWHERGLWREGVRWCERALELDGSSVAILGWLTHLYRARGDTYAELRAAEHWVSQARAAAATDDLPDALRSLADAAMRAGETTAARDALVDASTLTKADPAPHGLVAVELAMLDAIDGDHDAAAEALARALESVRAAGSPAQLIEALDGRRRFEERFGDPSDAWSAALDAVSLARSSADARSLARALSAAARVAAIRGDAEESFARSTNAVDGSDGRSDLTARALLLRADALRATGRTDEAADDARRAHALAETIGDEQGGAEAALALGLCAFNHDDLDAAQTHLVEARRRAWRGRWGPSLPARVEIALARLAGARGEHARAKSALLDVLARVQLAGDGSLLAACVEALAWVAERAGKSAEARDLLAAAIAYRTEIGRPVPLDQRDVVDKITAQPSEPAPDLERLVTELLAPHLISREATRAVAMWTEGNDVAFALDGRSFRLRDSIGLRAVRFLIASPGREFHALEVATATAQAGVGGDVTVTEGDTGALLDAEAKAAYRARLADLQEEVADAESMGDRERAALAEEEMDFITRELAAAVGLGGRDRRASSAAERARLNVTRAVRASIEKIREHDSTIAEHLDTSVFTGAFSRYDPPADDPLRWILSAR